MMRPYDAPSTRRQQALVRIPAGIPGADTRLETQQGGGVPYREDHIDGVLAVRRFGIVLGRVRDSGR